ncbi:TPA: acetyl/propionyl-CoA carboxylase subunit alpha, partial [Acinetobacter baumannii]|nr:acetyl/propionyl-CoA carboxylase subunit alpha [Acinetobacter baumannii]
LNEPDFTDEFNVHTRWIENDFKQELKPTKRGIPNHQQPMLLSYIEIDGKLHRLGLPAGMFAQGPATAAQAQTAEPEVSAEHLLAPINGVISAWKVENGEQVTEGQVVAIMEAMKMEVQVLAHRSGVIQIGAEKGTTCHAETAIASIH